jgi:hypothetical protein
VCALFPAYDTPTHGVIQGTEPKEHPPRKNRSLEGSGLFRRQKAEVRPSKFPD